MPEASAHTCAVESTARHPARSAHGGDGDHRLADRRLGTIAGAVAATSGTRVIGRARGALTYTSAVSLGRATRAASGGAIMRNCAVGREGPSAAGRRPSLLPVTLTLRPPSSPEVVCPSARRGVASDAG
jgi:hypothetical protein